MPEQPEIYADPLIRKVFHSLAFNAMPFGHAREVMFTMRIAGTTC